MKISWEPLDIKAGVRVRNPTCSEVWMIGYDPSAPGDGGRYCMVSLSDGMLAKPRQTQEAMAAHLNQTGEQPISLVGEKPR